MKVTVHTNRVVERVIKTKKGTDYKFTEQPDVTIRMNEYEVRQFPQNIDGKAPYPVGEYELNLETIVKMGDYGLEIDRYKPVNLTVAKPKS